MRTHTDLATMEGANEAARRAVNAILDVEAYPGARCRIWPLHEPLTLAPLRQYDAMRFGLGLPWDGGLMTVAGSGDRGGRPSARAGRMRCSMHGRAGDWSDVQNAADELEQVTPTDGTGGRTRNRSSSGHLGTMRDEARGPGAGATRSNRNRRRSRARRRSLRPVRRAAVHARGRERTHRPVQGRFVRCANGPGTAG